MWVIPDPGGRIFRVGEESARSSGRATMSSGMVGKELRTGDCVEVHSLRAKPEHNGKTGRLVGFDPETGRWEVHLDSALTAADPQKRILRVKRNNLTNFSGSGAAKDHSAPSVEFRVTHMTAEELLACCSAAHARREIASLGLDPEAWRPAFQITVPGRVQNAELVKMAGLYSSILTASPVRARALEILRTQQPDGTASLLYFLEYPRLVFASRHDSFGLEPPPVSRTAQKFPLKNILTKIQTDEEIMRFCRTSLDDETAHDVCLQKDI